MNDPQDSPKAVAVDFGRAPIEFTPSDPIGVLKFVGDLGADLVKEYEKRFREKVDLFTGDIIIDLSQCGTIQPVWTRPLMLISKNVKKNNRRLRVVSTSLILKAFFQDQGVGASFPFAASIEIATQEITVKKATKLDVGFINPFLEGTIEVFKKQAGLTAKAGAPGAREAASLIDGDVSGVIGLSAESFSGSVIITFPESTYVKLISKMLGEAHEAITPENSDGAAELMNIVFGHAKRALNQLGHDIKMARPSVVLGKDAASFPPVTGPRIAIPFESDVGNFTVEFRVYAT